MKVTVKMDNRSLVRLVKAQREATALTAEGVLFDGVKSQVIPFDEGTLQNISTQIDFSQANKGIVSITHDIIYASRLYFHPEYNFNQSKNPNAKGLWWEDYITGDKKNVASNLFKKFYRKAAGGTVK